MPEDQSTTSGAPTEVTLLPGAPLTVKSAERQRMRSRWIRPPRTEGWADFAMSEWELTGAGWADYHPHTETNLVLDGELHVECRGTTVVAAAGDTVIVPAGHVGRYWAPTYARMIAIYGPNPDAEQSDVVDYWEI